MGKRKTTAGLLALLGGIFGVHKFYLKEAPMGIFYIFLFVVTRAIFPVSLLLGVIDAIRLFSMTTKEFDIKYNRGGVQPRRRRSRNQRASQRPNPRRRAQNSKTSRKPKSNPFKNSGIKKYKEFEIDDAIEDLEKALLVNNADPEIYFTLACALSLSEKSDEAYKNLEQAIEYGFKDLKRIDAEDNLAFLRMDDGFESFKKNGFTSKKIQKLETKKEENLLDDDVLLSQLNKLAELRKKGLLSEKEFEYERKKLMRH